MTAYQSRFGDEQSAEQLSALFKLVVDAIITVNSELRITAANPAACYLFDYQPEELIGQSINILIPERFRAGHDTLVHNFANEKTAARLMNERTDIIGLRRDGSEFPAEGSIAKAMVGGELAMTVVLRDLTERYKQQDQMRQYQRMEVVGQLTGGVAHDFNNLLTVILGNLELLQADARLPEALERRVAVAISAAQRGARLTSELLSFSRQQPLKPEPYDLGEIISGLTEMMERTIGANISIVTVPARTLPPVNIDRAQLETAILNLALNARDSMQEGGTLTIESDRLSIPEEDSPIPELQSGEYVVVAVSDTGSGISKADLKNVFEPFFTTKNVGEGSGLGLSMVYGFLKQSGGHASIYSEPGTGTTVRLYLPVFVEGGDIREKSSEKPVSAKASPGNESVLLVEDDPEVRNYAKSVLKSLGYRVRDAADAVTAIQIFDSEGPFDLLFTDVMLPGGMTGRHVADHVTGASPQTRVLYTTGYTENAIVSQGRLRDGVILLGKPYGPRDLADKVRAVLDDQV